MRGRRLAVWALAAVFTCGVGCGDNALTPDPGAPDAGGGFAPDAMPPETHGVGTNVGDLTSSWSDAPALLPATPPATASFANPGGLKVFADGSVVIAGTFVGDLGVGGTPYTAPAPNSAVFVVTYAPDRHIARTLVLANSDGSVQNVLGFDATPAGAVAVDRSAGGINRSVSFTPDGNTWYPVAGIDPRFDAHGDLYVRDPMAGTIAKIAGSGAAAGTQRWSVAHGGVFLGFDAAGDVVVGDMGLAVLSAATGAVLLDVPATSLVTGGKIGPDDVIAYGLADRRLLVVPLSGPDAGTVRWSAALAPYPFALRGVDFDTHGAVLAALDSRGTGGFAQSDIVRLTPDAPPEILFEIHGVDEVTTLTLFGIAADGDDTWLTGSYRGLVTVGGKAPNGLGETNSRWLFAVKVLGTTKTFRAARLSESVEPNNILAPVVVPGGGGAILSGGFGAGILALAPGATVYTNDAPVTNFAGRVFVGEVR